ncbi:jg9396 [Pararge aegeria aegeria]|uniref:Jg9396 protein n=1 Tax=Pararge aegeria aegeria TaxID=348720 RepID=A0A8S4S6V3_9NEOP|nr:jg9396 [Pararge aegeria aegeria]
MMLHSQKNGHDHQKVMLFVICFTIRLPGVRLVMQRFGHSRFELIDPSLALPSAHSGAFHLPLPNKTLYRVVFSLKNFKEF